MHVTRLGSPRSSASWPGSSARSVTGTAIPGVVVGAGPMPVPESFTAVDDGSFVASSIRAVAAPPADGVNVTLSVHDALNASVAPAHALSLIAKSPGSSPVSVRPAAIVRTCAPTLRMVTVRRPSDAARRDERSVAVIRASGAGTNSSAEESTLGPPGYPPAIRTVPSASGTATGE